MVWKYTWLTVLVRNIYLWVSSATGTPTLYCRITLLYRQNNLSEIIGSPASITQQVLGYFSAFILNFSSCIASFSCVAQGHNKVISYDQPFISGAQISLSIDLCWTLREKFLQFLINIKPSITDIQPLGS